MPYYRGEQAFTAEGRIIRICDKIAYVNHDIEDAIRAEILQSNNIPFEFIDAFGDRYSQRINTMVMSLVRNSVDGNIKMSDDLEKIFNKIHKGGVLRSLC